MKSLESLHPTAQDFLDLLALPSVDPALSSAEEIEPNASVSMSEAFSEALSLPVRMIVNTLSPGEQPHEKGAGDQTFLWPRALLATSTTNGPADNATTQSGTEYVQRGMNCALQSLRNCIADLMFGFQKTWPAIEAAGQLFFRLFAPAILILSIVAFLFLDQTQNKGHLKGTRRFSIRTFSSVFASALAILCSGIIATDTMYIQEFGRTLLLGLYGAVCTLIVVRSHSKRFTLRFLAIPLTAFIVYHTVTCNHDLPTDTLKPGFYYDARNPIISKIVEQWPSKNRVYSSPSPWVLNGDTRTGIPFFVNNIPEQKYVRRYVPSFMKTKEENIILDIAFPTDGVHRRDKPIYFVLCGLVGGSQEGYVKDLVARKRADGHTVAVMVARGLMESTIAGEDLLLFADTADVRAALTALRKAAAADQLIAGVGFSMGAIIMANYVARSGADCKLDVAVGISGALDVRRQYFFRRSKRLWQPLLVQDLRDLIVSKFRKQLQKRLSPQQIRELETTSSVTGLDGTFFTRYHGFRDVFHYYSELGAMSDIVKLDGTPEEVGRIGNVSIPLLLLSALDDPIREPRTMKDPALVAKSGSGNILLLVTEKGGHVGWPQGWNPRAHGWGWMSNVASTFVDSADAVFRRNRGQDAKAKGTS